MQDEALLHVKLHMTAATSDSCYSPASERRWFVLKRPRCDINGESENEVTVTSKQHAQRGRGIEKVKY